MSLRSIAGFVAVGLVFAAGFLAGDRSFAQRVKTPRIAPVPRDQWTDQQKEVLASRMGQNGSIMNIYTTMANHPDLMRDWLVFAGHVLRRNSLPERDREILILRIGYLCQSEYEWGQHVRVGRGAGLSDADIQNITKGPSAPGISEKDRLLMQATDELHKDSFIADATWNALAKLYDTKQMMDLVFTVGEYTVVSMALNSFGVQREEGVAGFAK